MKRIVKILILSAFALLLALGALTVRMASAAGRAHGYCRGWKARLTRG